MRIVVDIQAIQSGVSAKRGIGRYTRALLDGMLRNAPQDEFILLLNGMVGEDNDLLRRDFTQRYANAKVRLWTAVAPMGFTGPDDNRLAAEAIREAVIADCAPDIFLETSLFEGFHDDRVTTVGNTLTAAVFYDIIPHIFSDMYLSTASAKEWYETKLSAMKRSDLLLAISECSLHDGLTHLCIPADRITNISSGVEEQFVVRAVDQAARDTLALDLSLTRPFLMYTGGTDPRKNLQSLITAFASLPEPLIQAYQLALVGPFDEKENTRLLAHAQKSGLPDGTVVITGFVSDETLITLYNACTAFVFPTLYEGFGLPVLEAMRCGAAVIGSNTSSVPEVIGRDDALFDPKSITDMARLIEKVLTDETFRKSLRDHAPVQAARFSWDQTALCALAAMRRLVEKSRGSKLLEKPIEKKSRLAFVFLTPPKCNGADFYDAELLPALAEHYDIELIVNQDSCSNIEEQARFPVRNVQWLRDHRMYYDRVLYKVENSTFHAHVFDLMDEIPGVVVLQNFFLSNLEHHMSGQSFTRLLAENHGYHAIIKKYDNSGVCDSLTEATQIWPMNVRAVQAAQGVIVHSEHAQILASRYYDPSTVTNWTVIPLLQASNDISDQARLEARMELGIAQDELLICSFDHGMLDELSFRLISGFLKSESAGNQNVRLAFWGEVADLSQMLLSEISGTPLSKRVQFIGGASDDLHHRYLQAADIAVRLECNVRDETLPTVLDCQNYGLPVITNAHDSLTHLPKDTVLRISDNFSDHELAQAIDRLVGDPDLRKSIGSSARKRLAKKLTHDACAQAYFDAIEAFQCDHKSNLISVLARLPVNEVRDVQLYQATADSLPSGARLRQLLVDVTTLRQVDANTGIQRVVRALLNEWLLDPPPGWRVEPVFADLELGRYRYARRFTCRFLGIPDDWAEDMPIDFFTDDHFVGLDLQMDNVPKMHSSLAEMAASGVRVSFVVYDLLPVLMPQNFPALDVDLFPKWLDIISRHEKLICISRAVADELSEYLREHPPKHGLMPHIGWFHLGADLETAKANISTLHNDSEMLQSLISSRPSFLMVGTVEPRKGHAFALTAFEQFWAAGGDATLIIVGKQGWKVEELCKRMEKHPENGKRLIWLDKATDEQLQYLYKNCTCLIAASEGEGFGLPLFEAAQHDLPILARDIPVFREIAGNHATFFDGCEPNSLYLALEGWLIANQAGNTPPFRGDQLFVVARKCEGASKKFACLSVTFMV